MRISDWSSDVCSSDLQRKRCGRFEALRATVRAGTSDIYSFDHDAWIGPEPRDAPSRFGSANVRRGGFERRRNDAGKFESAIDRKSVGWGKSVSIRVDLGGRRISKQKNTNIQER